MDVKEALQELIDAIDARWAAETPKKQEAAISPRMKRAIDNARTLLK